MLSDWEGSCLPRQQLLSKHPDFMTAQFLGSHANYGRWLAVLFAGEFEVNKPHAIPE
jgi:hypothetical protein